MDIGDLGRNKSGQISFLCACLCKGECGASSWSQTTGWSTSVSVVSATGETGVSETKQQPLERDQESKVLMSIVPMTGVSVVSKLEETIRSVPLSLEEGNPYLHPATSRPKDSMEIKHSSARNQRNYKEECGGEPGWCLHHLSGQRVPMLDHLFSKEIFPNIQSKPLLTQLEAISSRPITSYLGEEINTHLSTPSFQVVVESNKVSPQPPFLQAKQPQFPQPLLRRLVL
ncbi:hypothetical protein QYF61_000919 [Mycteria americana]|uniref:Uncharacterized protein n=1 Tax=Mycteria americana TaxID=33587 RepID=A0AAN7NDH6_MYCAM|nr:hypothetical protein QYF61_000919 [Mycteria americana]